MLTVRLLGQFSAEYRGVPLQLNARKAQALLAWLALAPGTPHRREQFASAFWPDAEREAGLGYVRRMLWQIRGALEAAGANPDDYLIANDIDIAFNPRASFWVDVQTLDHTADRRDASITDMMQAARLFNGELLPGFDDEWIDEFRPHCHTQFDKLMAHLLPKLQDEGRWRDMVDCGRHWAAHGDAVESAWQNVMVGFYGLGDTAGVRGAFKDYRQAMRKSFDAEPSAETETLYKHLLSGAFKLPGTTAQNRPQTNAESKPPPPPTNLPINLSPIVGREADVQRVLMELQPDGCRLLTLMGPGGIGKTRLALEAANMHRQRHPEWCADGVFLARLESVATGEALIPALADAVRMPSFGQESPRAQLLNFLREKRMLLVLDNFEQLLRDGIDGATVVADILANAPLVKMLVTSRERLHLDPDEHLLELDGLDYPAYDDAEDLPRYSAVQLFAQAARRIYSRFDFEREKAGVARICRLTQGMPLALELAAAWVRALSCAEIAARIAQTLDALAAERPELPERHRSVRAVLDYSWKLLSPGERNAFAALSVFRAGFQLAAAEDVARATVTLLYALVDKSLLRRTPAGRYEMHELVRQFGEEKLDAVEDEDWRDNTVHARMARYFLHFAKENAKEYAALEPEWGNFLAALRAAHERYEWPIVTELAQVLIEPWFTRARFTDAREGLALASTAAAADDDLRSLANVLRWRGRACIEQGEYSAVVEYFNTAYDLYQQIGDTAAIADVRRQQAWLATEQGNHNSAAELLNECLSLHEKLDDASGRGEAQFQQARLAYLADDYDKARALALVSLGTLETTNNTNSLLAVLRLLASIASDTAAYEDARHHAERALSLAKQAGDSAELASVLYILSQISRRLKQFDDARAYALQSLELQRQFGRQKSQAHLYLQLSFISYDEYKYDLALNEVDQSLNMYKRLADEWNSVTALYMRGKILAAQKQADQANATWSAGLSIAERLQHPHAALIQTAREGLPNA